jgi:hypothetical protein
MKRVVWVFAFVLAMGRHMPSAHADDEEEPWKDGCPGKYAPEALPKDLPDLPTHRGAAAFGPMPEIDSTLGPTRVGAAMWFGSLSPQDMPYPQPANLLGTQIVAQYDIGSTGPIAMLSYAAADAIAYGGTMSGYSHLANFQAYVGYRHTGYLLRPALRRGWSVRIGGGSAFDGNQQQLVDERQHMAVIAPFRSQLFGFDRPLTATIEYRIEMIGCHGPFVHARVDGSTWQAQQNSGASFPRIYVIPISIAAGGFIYPRFALYGQFGIEFRAPVSVMAYGHVTRTSLGGEWQPASHREHFNLRLSALSGDNARGLEATLAMSAEL